MKHTYYVCTETTCNGCQFCHGGLSWCTVCNGFEGSLTVDCCGRKITAEEEDLIYKKGTLDYRDGQGWINPKCDDLFGRKA